MEWNLLWRYRSVIIWKIYPRGNILVRILWPKYSSPRQAALKLARASSVMKFYHRWRHWPSSKSEMMRVAEHRRMPFHQAIAMRNIIVVENHGLWRSFSSLILAESTGAGGGDDRHKDDISNEAQLPQNREVPSSLNDTGNILVPEATPFAHRKCKALHYADGAHQSKYLK